MCRQRIDPAEWDAHGGAVLGSHAEWSDRACGMAALRMILLAYRGAAPPLTELIKTGVRAGALTDRGWLHAGIARLAASFGIPAAAEAVAAADLPARLASAPLIISVTEQFPTDGRQGGHLVVARGITGSVPDGPDILIRDPSAWGQSHDRIPLARLSASYTGRCITFAPMPASPAGKKP
jgi:Peptidase C39 family